MTDRNALVVLDTNVFVAAGFNPRSSSAALRELVAQGEVRLVWTEETKRETATILRRIPHLRWQDAEPLFRPEMRYGERLATEPFDYVEDPDDRKFAALAAASGATLVTADDDLLRHRGREDISIVSPSTFLRCLRAGPCGS